MNITDANFPFGLLFVYHGECAIRAATEAERDAAALAPGLIFVDMLTRIDGDIHGGTIVRPVPCYVAPYTGSHAQNYQLGMASEADRASVMNVAETAKYAETHAMLSRF